MGTFTPSDSDLGTYKEYSTVSESITFRDSVAPAQETKPVDITPQETNPATLTITDGDPATITGKYDEYFPKEIYYLTKSGEYKTATSFKQIDITEVDEIIYLKSSTTASKTFNYDASVNYTEDSVTSPATLDWSYHGTSDATLETSAIHNPNYYGTATDDRLGTSIAVSDDHIVVSSIAEDSKEGTSSGIAYIFDRETEELLYTLPNPNGYKSTDDNWYGLSVAVSSDYTVVGTLAKVVYVYRTSTRELIHTIESPEINNKFGRNVALSGNYLIISSPYLGLGGPVYVYDISQLTTSTVTTSKYTITLPSGYRLNSNDGADSQGAAFSPISIDVNYIAICAESTATLPPGTPIADRESYVLVYDIASFGTASDITTPDYILENPNAYGSTSGDDDFARAVVVSGDYIAVNAVAEDDSGGTNSGKVYVYKISNFSASTITSSDYVLDNPNYYNTSTNDYYGSSLAISGDYLVVGAVSEESSGGFSDHGVAYVYDMSSFSSSTITSADYTLVPDDTSDNYNFGHSISISGNYIVVGGANYYNVDSPNEKVYIYNVSNFSTSVITSADYVLSNPNTYPGVRTDDAYGKSVSISGNNVVVGTPGEESITASSNSGVVYVYDISGFTSSSISSADYVLTNPGVYGTAQNDYFGLSVALSGNKLAISARNEDVLQSNTEEGYYADAGMVYYYDISTFTTNTPAVITTATQVIPNPNINQYDGSPEDRDSGPAGDLFGSSLAFNDTHDYLIVGAMGTEFTDEEDDDSGAVYIFDISSGSAVLQHTLYNPNNFDPFGNNRFDYFGIAVATSGNYLAVGASFEDFGTPPNYTDFIQSSGVVYMYNLSTMSGSSITTSDYVLESPQYYANSTTDQFGQHLSMEGTKLFVGALGADSPTQNQDGLVYMYSDVSSFSSSPITTADYTITNPGSAASSFSRYGISASGNYLAVGSPNEDNATTGGKVYIYDTSSFSTSVITSADITINNPNDIGSGANDGFGSRVLLDGNYLFAASPVEYDSTETYSGSGVLYKIVNVPSVVTTEEVDVDESKNYTITLENDWSVGQFDMATYGNYEQPPSRPYWLNKNGEKVTWINNIKITTHWI